MDRQVKHPKSKIRFLRFYDFPNPEWTGPKRRKLQNGKNFTGKTIQETREHAASGSGGL